MKYLVKDISLAAQGNLKIQWAENEMPVLKAIAKEFKAKQPFKNTKIAACLHVTKETAVLAKVLAQGGASVFLCGSNPLSTQDDVAAALAKSGINIYAWRGISNKDYYRCLNLVLDGKPQITIDDGADLISLIHSKRTEALKSIWAGQEETTTGVIRLKAMAKDGALKYPVVAVNDTPTKHMFDNYYGTGQSTLDAVIRATNILLAGKKVVVAGYGYCGSGVAQKARGLGAHVIVTEVDPVKSLRAVMDGFYVAPMREAAKLGDIFITATGDRDVITKKHMAVMKDRAMLANTGHFNVEISIPDLESLSKSHRPVSSAVEEYNLNNGNKIYLLAEGRLVNLAAAEGHPSSVMDMSFADQALTAAWLAKNHSKLSINVHNVPDEIDRRVAKLKLAAMGVKIDILTPEQKKYLASWQEGT
ncbi:MAG: adenosylhomocysteinase [Patescibacteria group bacterium]|nr:adenosylhomocysteinase [Patescibacteria group bacterium]